MHTRTMIAGALGALMLGACGGGGGGTSVPLIAGTEVPEYATSSSAGAFAFVKLTAATSSETDSPLIIGDVKLATSETDEPDPGV